MALHGWRLRAANVFYVYFAIVIFFNNVFSAPSNMDKIILGAIFEQDSEEVQSAFKIAILSHNHNDSGRRFELQAFVDVINTADAFKLSRIICNQFNRGVHTMVGSVNPESFDTLHSYSNTFQVPFVTPWFPEKILTPSSGSMDFAISMQPEYHNAMIEIINYYGWENIIYIYESQEGLLRLQQMYQSVHPDHQTFKIDAVRKIRNSSDAIAFLAGIESLNRWGNKYVVLDCSTNLAKQVIIAHARSVILGKRTYHYLLSGLVMDDRWEGEKLEYGAINITGFRVVDEKKQYVKRFFDEWYRLDADVAKKNSGPRQGISAHAALMHDTILTVIEGFNKLLKKKPEIFRKGDKKGTGVSTSHGVNGGNSITSWGVDCNTSQGWVTPWEHGDKISRFFRRVEAEGLTGLIKFNEQGRRYNYTLYVFEMTLHNAMVKIADWNDLTGLKVLREIPKRMPSEITIPKNKTYIFTSVLEEPFMSLKKAANGESFYGNDRFEGYSKDLADLLSRKLGINYVIVPTKDGKHGTKDTKTGMWNGMIGELITHEADLAIGPLMITSEREKVVDFSKPYMSFGTGIIMKKLEKQPPSIFNFLDPFTKEVWIGIGCSFVAVSVMLFIVSRFSPSEWRLVSLPVEYPSNNKRRSTESRDSSQVNLTVVNEFGIFNCFWFSIGSLLHQSSNLYPRSLSGRIVSCVWWLFTLFMLSSYIANLTSILTVNQDAYPIASVDDLSSQSDIEYGMVIGESTWDLFRKSKIPMYKKMWDVMNKKPKVMVQSYEEGIERIRKSKGMYALLAESSKIMYTNNRKPCDTVKVGNNLDVKGMGIATPIGSPIKETVNDAILSMVESGELNKLEHHWWLEKSDCTSGDKLVKTHNSLSLTNVAGVFYILIGGLIIALVIGLVEFCYKSKFSESTKSKLLVKRAMKNKTQSTLESRPIDNGRKREVYHQYYGPANHLNRIDSEDLFGEALTQV